ncbi:MAG: aminoacetone oxidase family FAD-binding enzyme [Clostridia bacterium]|nr:aminoacetone oxidase family FAD-binding enzyme [Clostridia bacterium]
MYDVIVLGGGAGGIVCAGKCALGGKSVLLLESGERIGRKILMSGNGRCNLSNINVAPDKYNRPDFVRAAIEKYGAKQITDFFESINLLCRSDTEGRIYPHSMSAGSVLNALCDWLNKSGCDIALGCTAQDIRCRDGVYYVQCNSATYSAKCVVLACGSAAGGGKNSYSILQAFNIKTTALSSALTYIKTPDFKGLKGVKAKVKIKVTAGGAIHESLGEILFRDDGISGIAAFWASTFIARNNGGDIEIDFAPEYSKEKLLSVYGGKGAESLRGLLHRALSDRLATISKSAGADGVIPLIKSYKFKAKTLGDIKDCQVVCGGLDTSQWDSYTLSSKRYPNLYCIGEMLDIDGECGGYNLHWAWASAMTAAEDIVSD